MPPPDGFDGNGPRRIPFVGPEQPSVDRENRDFVRAAVSRDRAAVTTSTRPALEAVSAPSYGSADGPSLLVNPTVQRMPEVHPPPSLPLLQELKVPQPAGMYLWRRPMPPRFRRHFKNSC